MSTFDQVPLFHRPQFRVDKVLNWGKNRPVAWFVDIFEADAYVLARATDPLNSEFDFKIVDLATED